MPNFNRIILMGNLVRDPSLTSAQDGLPVCRFILAVNRRFRDVDDCMREEVEYFDVMVTGDIADRCRDTLKKGSPVFVEGRLHLTKLFAKQANAPRTSPIIFADKVVFVASRTSGGVEWPREAQEVEVSSAHGFDLPPGDDVT